MSELLWNCKDIEQHEKILRTSEKIVLLLLFFFVLVGIMRLVQGCLHQRQRLGRASCSMGGAGQAQDQLRATCLLWEGRIAWHQSSCNSRGENLQAAQKTLLSPFLFTEKFWLFVCFLPKESWVDFFFLVNFSKFFIIGLSEHATFFSLAFLTHGSGFQVYIYALELCRPSAHGSSFCMLNSFQ